MAMKTVGHAYTYTRMRTYAQALRAYASCMRKHTRACMRMLGFQQL